MSTSELLVYGLVVAGFLLVNYVMQRLANKARQQQQGEASGAPPQPQEGEEELADYSWGRAPVAQPAAYEPPQTPVPVYAAPPAQPVEPGTRIHPAARRLLHDGRQVRHAIVLMTVLGHCRAIEPYDTREP